MARKELPKLQYSADLSGDLPAPLKKLLAEFRAKQEAAKAAEGVFIDALHTFMVKANQIPNGKGAAIYTGFGKVSVAWCDPDDPRNAAKYAFPKAAKPAPAGPVIKFK